MVLYCTAVFKGLLGLTSAKLPARRLDRGPGPALRLQQAAEELGYPGVAVGLGDHLEVGEGVVVPVHAAAASRAARRDVLIVILVVQPLVNEQVAVGACSRPRGQHLHGRIRDDCVVVGQDAGAEAEGHGTGLAPLCYTPCVCVGSQKKMKTIKKLNQDKVGLYTRSPELSDALQLSRIHNLRRRKDTSLTDAPKRDGTIDNEKKNS